MNQGFYRIVTVLAVLVFMAGCWGDSRGPWRDVSDKVEILWTIDLPHPTTPLITLNGRFLYVPGSVGMAKIDLEVPQVLWQTNPPDPYWDLIYTTSFGAPVCIDGRVHYVYYGPSNTEYRSIIVFDDQTGSCIGAIRISFDHSPARGAIFGSNNALYWSGVYDSAILGISDLDALVSQPLNNAGYWDVSLNNGITNFQDIHLPGYPDDKTLIGTAVCRSDELGLTFFGVHFMQQSPPPDEGVNGQLYAFRHAEGLQFAWQYETDWRISPDEIQVNGDQIFLGLNRDLINARTGDFIKKLPDDFTLPGGSLSTYSPPWLTYADGLGAVDDNQVGCYNVETNQFVWTDTLNDFSLNKRVIVNEGVAYIADGLRLYLLDAATGARLGVVPGIEAGQVSSGPYRWGSDKMIVESTAGFQCIKLDFHEPR